MEGKNLIVLSDVTERIRYYARRSAGDMLELGKALTEAKELVPHGEWEGYVKENAGMELRMAQNFMQAYRKWGTGNPDLSRLNVGQMIALLPASSEEIDKISENKDIGSMSSREIKAALLKARQEGRAEAEEEHAEKTRDAMQCMANDKARELARQKETFDKAIREKEIEAREQLDALQIQLEEQKEAAEALRKRAEQAEANAKAATEAAIETSKNVSQQSNQMEAEKERLQQEIDDRDASIEELQEQYDRIKNELLNLQSTISRGDAERSNADILSAESMQDAVSLFLGQVGRVPYMHNAFSVMEDRELEDYRATILQVADWANKSLKAVEAVHGRGVVE